MTSQPVAQLPSPWRSYLRALQDARKPIRKQAASGRIDTAVLAPEPQRLARYRQLCGLADGAVLPPLWPQILAGPLHLQLVTQDDWPAPALGMVHLRNSWEELEPIPSDAALSLHVQPGPLRDAPAGLEVAIDTEVRREGRTVWRSQLVALHRVLGKKGKPTPGPDWNAPQRQPDGAWALAVPEDIGRAYGRVAGDINPIHIHALAARAFGFKRAIAHGTWTVARALGAASALLPTPSDGPVLHSAQFLRPLFLPGQVVVEAWRDGATTWWQVRSQRDAATIHVRGAAVGARGQQ